MDANDREIESALQAKGLNAPRVTPTDVEAAIVGEHYFTALEGVAGELHVRRSATQLAEVPGVLQLGLLTFCVLVLRNEFTVTGESACASPENFDAEIGRKVARQHAVEKVWPLLGYALRDRLAAQASARRDTTQADDPNCPHAAPFRYCAQCVVDPCPIGLGKAERA